MPFCCSHAKCSAPVRIRNRTQSFLRVSRDQWQDHKAQSQSTGQQRITKFQRCSKKHASEKSENNRWDTGKCLSRKFNDPYNLARFGILIQINGTSHTDRRCDHQRDHDDIQRIDNISGNADRSFSCTCYRCQKLQAYTSDSSYRYITDDHQKNRNCYGC